MAAILNFQIFRKTQKCFYLKTVRDRAISAKFLTHRISVKTNLSKFQRILRLPKMTAILNLRIFFKNAKHKNACILKTVLGRAILMKFWTRRVTLLSDPVFKKIFVPPKMVAILNFRIFRKTQKCLYLKNLAR